MNATDDTTADDRAVNHTFEVIGGEPDDFSFETVHAGDLLRISTGGRTTDYTVTAVYKNAQDVLFARTRSGRSQCTWTESCREPFVGDGPAKHTIRKKVPATVTRVPEVETIEHVPGAGDDSFEDETREMFSRSGLDIYPVDEERREQVQDLIDAEHMLAAYAAEERMKDIEPEDEGKDLVTDGGEDLPRVGFAEDGDVDRTSAVTAKDIDALVDLYDEHGKESVEVRVYYRGQRGGVCSRDGYLTFSSRLSWSATVSIDEDPDDYGSRRMKASTNEYGRAKLTSLSGGRMVSLGNLLAFEVLSVPEGEDSALMADGGEAESEEPTIHPDYRSGGKLAGELADAFESVTSVRGKGSHFTVEVEGHLETALLDKAAKHGFRVSYTSQWGNRVRFVRMEDHPTDPRTGEDEEVSA